MLDLIAFFSREDENYVSGMIKKLEIGNTARVAGVIQKLINADMFRIEMAKPYSKNYNECIDEAQKDQNEDARPELIKYPENIEKYDTIYLG